MSPRRNRYAEEGIQFKATTEAAAARDTMLPLQKDNRDRFLFSEEESRKYYKSLSSNMCYQSQPHTLVSSAYYHSTWDHLWIGH
jgi:hypothetical protein